MAKRVLPEGMKKKSEKEANPSDVEGIPEEGERPSKPTIFEKETSTMEATPDLRVASIPTGEAELVSNAPDLRALDADISAFECLDFEVRGGADGTERFARHLADIERAVTEASVSVPDAVVLKDRLVLSRQLAFVSNELGLTGLIYNKDAVKSVLTRSNAELEELLARILDLYLTIQTSGDCGQHLQSEVGRHLRDLTTAIDAELAKPERAKPAKQPCAGPEQWPEGKPSTTELKQVVDSLGVDPGAATVAAPAEGAAIPLTVKRNDGSEEWPTAAHEAVPMTGVFVSTSRETEEKATRDFRSPLPPPPAPGTALIDPFDVVPFDSTAAAGAVADLLLAQIPPAPPAGPAHPEPEPQADPALAHTEAVPITPPKGVPATAPLGGQIGQTMVGNPTGSQPAVAPVEPPPAAPPKDQTAEQVDLFQTVVGASLNVEAPDVSVIAALPDDLIANRLRLARDFLSDGERLPLTGEVNRRIIAFIMKYEEALGRKLNPFPTPDPAKSHGPSSRPAMAAPAPPATPSVPPYRNPWEVANPAVAKAVPKSEALTGVAPAVSPPAPAAPLPTPVINVAPPSLPSVMLSPSFAPPPPAVSPFSAVVGGSPVRPGMQAGMYESTEATEARKAAERRQQEAQRLQRRAKVKQIALRVVGGVASLIVGGAIVLGVLFFYRRLVHQEALLNKLTSQSEEVSQAMRDAARERGRSVAADAEAARQDQHASTGNGRLRCSPASQRLECSSLPPDTHQSPTGPGYYCPEGAPMEPMGSGGYNACHCQWCQ